MIVGGEKITETATKLRAIVEADSEDELVEIDDVFVIAVVHYGDPDDEHSSGSLFYRSTSARYHIQLGILEHAKHAVDAQQVVPDE